MDQIEAFSLHLIYHYKKVGAARTEKSRLRKESKPMKTRVVPSEEKEAGITKGTTDVGDNAESTVAHEPESISDSPLESAEPKNVSPSKEIALDEKSCAPSTSTPEGDSKKHADGAIDSELEEIPNETAADAEEEGIPKYPYTCDICVNKKIFNRAEYIIRHLRKHSGEYFCFECGQVCR